MPTDTLDTMLDPTVQAPLTARAETLRALRRYFHDAALTEQERREAVSRHDLDLVGDPIARVVTRWLRGALTTRDVQYQLQQVYA